jgi:hypothetical protein
MSPLGSRETDTLYTRRALLELNDFATGQVIQTAPLDLVDMFPAKTFRVFNPAAVPLAPPFFGSQEFPLPSSLGGSDGAFPEPRFVVHYFIGCGATVRSQSFASYMELRFCTQAFSPLPTTALYPVAVIPWVGQAAVIDSQASGGPSAGEAQTGRIVITGRWLTVFAVFNDTFVDLFSCGVYVSPIRG